MRKPPYFNRQASIVGIGQTRFAKSLEPTEEALGVEAALQALEDAGIHPSKVNGLVCYQSETTEPNIYARDLGCTLNYWSAVNFGGGAGPALVLQAAMAIAAGLAEVVLCVRSRKRGTQGGPWQRGTLTSPDYDLTRPFGAARPVDIAALTARAYMEEYGWTSEMFAQVAAVQREHALRNPNALMNKPLTVADHQASAFICDPLRLYDCCLETDGAVALVLTGASEASVSARQPVVVETGAQGMGQNTVHMGDFQKPKLAQTNASAVARRLWAQTDLTPADISCAQLYDGFSPFVLIQLVEYGLVKADDLSALLSTGGLRFDGGRIPVNTSGGGLSEGYIHGMNLVLEAVRQLRGTSSAQAPHVNHVLVTGAPIVGSSAVILGRGYK